MPASAPPPPLLAAAWAAADALFEREVTSARADVRPISLRHPFVFYLGHLPAFLLNTARLARPRDAALPPPAEWDALFARGIDPSVDASVGSTPSPPSSWPSWAAVVAYRDAARAAALRASLPRAATALVAEHDLMHVETLCYMLAQDAAGMKETAVDTGAAAAAAAEVPSRRWLPVPSGSARLGRAREGEAGVGVKEVDMTDAASDGRGGGEFGWDNEFPAATVHVRAFEVTEHPVTVAEFAAFVTDGGYERKELWRQEDWTWVLAGAVAHPASWRPARALRDGNGNERRRGQWDVLTVDGRVPAEGEAAAWPVSVCLAEARAYAVYAKARLLSEAEWDRAACGNDGGGVPWAGERSAAGSETGAPVGGVHGNFGWWARRPVAINALDRDRSWMGARSMFGNGWELVDTLFEPLPGFQPMELYPEYSADFFDGKHFVLKGASWATDARLVRRSFRNFYQARYPYMFSKFRLARDIPNDLAKH